MKFSKKRQYVIHHTRSVQNTAHNHRTWTIQYSTNEEMETVFATCGGVRSAALFARPLMLSSCKLLPLQQRRLAWGSL